MSDQSWPCKKPGVFRYCEHPDCKPVPVELDGGFRTDLPPAQSPAPRPVSPGPTRLTADQIIRAEALASAARAHPNSDPEWILGKAAKYARWIRYGGGDQ